MAQAVRVHEVGGPEVLVVDDITPAVPGDHEVLIRQYAIGVNYIDIYHRTGLYKLLNYPVTLGLEGAGVIEHLGSTVTGFAIGDRVAYCGGPVGAYAQYRTIPAKHIVKLPDAVSFEQAAGGILKGLTAHVLLTRTFAVQPGDTVLIHAAAGGVGLIACQMAKQLGATVIGTTSSDEKAALARENGCDHTILYTREDVAQKVRELTQGQGADVVYDSVGQSTFMGSLDSLKRFGMLVNFGQSSGAIPPFDISLLAQKGSLYLSRPTLLHHIEDVDYYASGSAAVLDMMAKGALTIRVGGTYPLEKAKQAHIDLESRKTKGALVLRA